MAVPFKNRMESADLAVKGMRTKSWTESDHRKIRMYTYEQQMAAVKLSLPSWRIQCASRMLCEVNSNADSEFDLRVGSFYT